jgi:serine phosphatase RsbU (regulator of sigma subunit)
MNSIQNFVAGAEQFDDITMLCLKYFGPEAAQQKQS